MENNSNPNVDTIIDKLNQIFDLICDIANEDQALGNVLKEFYTLSLRTVSAIESNGGDTSKIDVSEHIKIISNILGVDVRDMMEQALKEASFGNVDPGKEADAATLEFITSDLDDYEKFIAQNKAKESLDFLSKEL
jgi:hypothetical protein